MPESRIEAVLAANRDLAFRADLLALGATLVAAEDRTAGEAWREAAHLLAWRCPGRPAAPDPSAGITAPAPDGGDVGFGVKLAGSRDLAVLAAALLAAAASAPPRTYRPASSRCG